MSPEAQELYEKLISGTPYNDVVGSTSVPFKSANKPLSFPLEE